MNFTTACDLGCCLRTPWHTIIDASDLAEWLREDEPLPEEDWMWPDYAPVAAYEDRWADEEPDDRDEWPGWADVDSLHSFYAENRAFLAR